jgi:hypothetical protein
MAYHQLVLAPHTPQPVVDFIRRHGDMQFHDVHVMLRLPLPEPELDAGCNFASARWLLTLIGGLSTVIYKHTGDAGERFREALVQYYPWQYEPEPPQGVRAQEGAHLLYDLFRNPLEHALGVSTERHGSGRDTLIRLQRRNHPLDLNIVEGALSEAHIENLELSPTRPDYAQATIVQSAGRKDLLVAGLYWGVRHMVYQLTSDHNVMAATASFLSGTTLPQQGEHISYALPI